VSLRVDVPLCPRWYSTVPRHRAQWNAFTTRYSHAIYPKNVWLADRYYIIYFQFQSEDVVTQNTWKTTKVQRRFTKRLRWLRNVGYTERLNRLGLPTLELRRLQLELIFCYKIVFGLTSLTSSDYFQFGSNTNTRGHAYKLYKPQNFCKIRRKFLSCRILTVWNSLPANTDFSSPTAFRRASHSTDLAKFLHCNSD